MEGHMWFRHIFSRYALMTSYEMSRSVACLPYAATSYQFAVVSGMKEQLWEAVLAADPQNQSLMVAFVYAFSCESSVTALPQLYLFIFFTFSFLSFFFCKQNDFQIFLMVLCVCLWEKAIERDWEHCFSSGLSPELNERAAQTYWQWLPPKWVYYSSKAVLLQTCYLTAMPFIIQRHC